jgi:hypothetical protein
LSQVCFDECCFFRADGLIPFQRLRESAVGGYLGFIWTHHIDLPAGLLSAHVVVIINLGDVNHGGELTTDQINLPSPQEARKSLVRDSIVHLAKLQRAPKYRLSEISRPFRKVRDISNRHVELQFWTRKTTPFNFCRHTLIAIDYLHPVFYLDYYAVIQTKLFKRL